METPPNVPPPISGFNHATILNRLGTALSRVKSGRNLTLPDMAQVVRKSDDQLARYIAGDQEMTVVAWLLAVEAWPELPDLFNETDADRAIAGRQRALDFNQKKEAA